MIDELRSLRIVNLCSKSAFHNIRSRQDADADQNNGQQQNILKQKLGHVFIRFFSEWLALVHAHGGVNLIIIECWD